jgi:hypothetical protein
MNYAKNINVKNLKSQQDTLNHLESVLSVLDKSKTDNVVIRLV